MVRKTIFALAIFTTYMFGVISHGIWISKPLEIKENSTQLQAKFDLLAKRIFIEDPNEPIIAFSDLRTQLNQYFIDNQVSGNLYFEYLPTGTSIRIGVEERRVAASLIKLPFAMEAYYAKEKKLIDFNQKITITDSMLSSTFGDLYKKGAGTELTLREALEIMLKDSDNTALNAVVSVIEGVVPAKEGPFNFLDAEFVQNEDFTVSLTPRAYSSFLKCLYFSCYLEKEDSQEILKLLSESSLVDRIPAGIPENVTIAHKVGNYLDTTQSDCGIVYEPKRNYLICMMLDGADAVETDEVMAEISKIVYDYVSTR